MLAKLSADILDRLDIFILDIEELQIPKVRLLLQGLNVILLVFLNVPFSKSTSCHVMAIKPGLMQFSNFIAQKQTILFFVFIILDIKISKFPLNI